MGSILTYELHDAEAGDRRWPIKSRSCFAVAVAGCELQERESRFRIQIRVP